MPVEAEHNAARRNGSAEDGPRTAQQAVLEGLRKMVITGELAPGSAIKQDEIAERFGVSRVPAREALKMLEGEGHVTHVAHHGFRVVRLSITELIEVYAMREWIETGLVRASVPLLGRSRHTVMVDAMKQMAAAAAESDLVTVSRQNQLWDATDPYRPLYFDQHFDADTVNIEHEEIVDAAFSHDADRTVRLLNLHRSDAIGHLRALEGSAG